MNEQERAEFEQLKKRQADLVAQLADLGWQLDDFESRLAQSAAATPAPPIPAPPIIVPPLEPTPIISQVFEEIPTAPPVPTASLIEEVPATETPAAPPFITLPPLTPVAEPVPIAARVARVASSESTPPPPPPPLPPDPSQGSKGSFEMRLGTYWLVRIGIVMLLTGLVFFGAYAYHNFWGKIGAPVKVGLLYCASAGLLAVGAWLERKEEKMRNYAQVLLAGGLAAVYFTTFAAHHFPPLLVITDPLLDGALLLGWAAFMVWLADRKKSEVLALFAVILAYYTSVITHVGMFTLYSNCVLTAAAVFFLVRNRWAALSFASLAATYVSYCFWRFYVDGEWQFAGPGEGLWTGNYFLMGYWALFTAAVFLSRNERLDSAKRTAFLSLNNAAFFTAFILTMWQVRLGGFWKFALIYGSVLLALAVLARQLFTTDRLCRNAYLTQGLLLVTIGLINHFSDDGPKLTLILGAESVALVMLGRQMKSPVLEGAALIAGALGACWGLTTIQPFDHANLIKCASFGALMLVNAFAYRRDTTFEQSTTHFRTIFFTTLGLGMWLATTWENEHPVARALAIAIEASVFLVAARPLGNGVLVFGSYVFATIAVAHQVVYLGDEFDSKELALRLGLAQAIIVGALMLFSAVWTQRKSPPKTPDAVHLPVSLFSLLALGAWLAATWVFTPREYLAPLLAVEAVLLTASYYPLRLKEVSVFAQGFLLLAQGLWLYDVNDSKLAHPWWNPAIVIVATLLLAHWWQRQKTLTLPAPAVLGFQGLYAIGIIALLFFWLHPHFSAPVWLAFTSGLAILLTAYGALNRYWLLVAAGQVFLIVSGWEFAVQLFDGQPEWHFALAPIIALGLLSFSTIKWFERRPDARPEIKQPILYLGMAYRICAAIMALWWVHKYIPAREVCWVLALTGLVLFLAAGWRRNQEILVFSAVFTLAALVQFCFPRTPTTAVYWPNLLVMLGLLAQQRLARRLPDKFTLPDQAHGTIIVVGGLGLWLFLTRWILESPGKSYLTAGWSALALVLFVIGMTLRERVYRWLGLALLACAFGHVLVIDVWKLDMIYRVLSFMALGMVLLVLGFIYTKYQEKIREWL